MKFCLLGVLVAVNEVVVTVLVTDVLVETVVIVVEIVVVAVVSKLVVKAVGMVVDVEVITRPSMKIWFSLVTCNSRTRYYLMIQNFQ